VKFRRGVTWAWRGDGAAVRLHNKMEMSNNISAGQQREIIDICAPITRCWRTEVHRGNVRRHGVAQRLMARLIISLGNPKKMPYVKTYIVKWRSSRLGWRYRQ